MIHGPEVNWVLDRVGAVKYLRRSTTHTFAMQDKTQTYIYLYMSRILKIYDTKSHNIGSEFIILDQRP